MEKGVVISLLAALAVFVLVVVVPPGGNSSFTASVADVFGGIPGGYMPAPAAPAAPHAYLAQIAATAPSLLEAAATGTISNAASSSAQSSSSDQSAADQSQADQSLPACASKEYSTYKFMQFVDACTLNQLTAKGWHIYQLGTVITNASFNSACNPPASNDALDWVVLGK